jgi:hypothetical protein
MGYGCKCGQRFPTKKTAEAHAADQNLIEQNEAKAKQAEGQATELAHQAHEATEPAMEPESPAQSPITTEPPTERKPGDSESKPEAPTQEPTSEEKSPAVESPSEATQAMSPSNLPLDLDNLSLNQINFIGQTMAKSGMFPDVKDGAKALVKILAGKEIGVTPFQAMTNIHIIQGKATMGANLMAAKVKGSGKYDYRVTKLTNKVCKIMFKQRAATVSLWEELGEFTYAIEDAERAGLIKDGSSWVKYPQNMLFARAISSGVRLYCPDVFNGNLVYVPEEMGAQVDEDGEPVGKAA